MIRCWLALTLAAPFLLAQECTFVVSPASLTLPATGDAQLAPTLTVTASRIGCTWTARSNVPWITVSFGQVGANNGTVGIRVEQNRDAASRMGSLTIAGQTVSVNQAAANCTFTLNPSSKTANAAGESGSLQVVTTCNWQATTNADWIAVTSPPGGLGSGGGTVTYAVRANTGATRSGTIQVGPLRFTVQQPAGACTQTLNPTHVNLPATGGNGTVQVTSPCMWTAASNAVWISVTGGGAADRDGTLSYSVQANTLAQSRSGSIRIGNQVFTVNQTGTGCAVALTPTSATVPAAGGTGTIAVSSTCNWNAVASEPWIVVSANAVTVSFVVDRNTGGTPRSGTITIGDQVFSISQVAGACAVTLSPAAVQLGSTGGSGNFLVSGPAGCQWTVSTAADWISLNISSGDGSGTVIYSVAPNPGPVRSSTIDVSSQRFTISQAGVLPSFTAGGIVSAASFQTRPLAPGVIVTIFGSGLGPSTPVLPKVDPVARKFPSELADTRVLFDGVAAPLLFVSAGQLSAVAPFGIGGGQTTRIEVETASARSQAVFMPIAATAPAIFTQAASGKGPGAILNQDFSLNGPDNPALPGSFVSIYGTGGGAVVPATIDGMLATGASTVLTRVTAEVDGQPAEVSYAGGAPDLVGGMLQVNLRLPVNLRPGDLPVVLWSGESVSQPGVTVSVK